MARPRRPRGPAVRRRPRTPRRRTARTTRRPPPRRSLTRIRVRRRLPPREIPKWKLSQKFVQLFLVSRAQGGEPRERGADAPGASADQAKLKTKVRRLYDIANILSSLRLIEKTHLTDSRKPAFRWLGVEKELAEAAARARRQQNQQHLQGAAPPSISSRASPPPRRTKTDSARWWAPPANAANAGPHSPRRGGVQPEVVHAQRRRARRATPQCEKAVADANAAGVNQDRPGSALGKRTPLPVRLERGRAGLAHGIPSPASGGSEGFEAFDSASYGAELKRPKSSLGLAAPTPARAGTGLAGSRNGLDLLGALAGTEPGGLQSGGGFGSSSLGSSIRRPASAAEPGGGASKVSAPAPRRAPGLAPSPAMSPAMAQMAAAMQAAGLAPSRALPLTSASASAGSAAAAARARSARRSSTRRRWRRSRRWVPRARQR